MTVNLDYETLQGEIKAATLCDACRISASEARPMACELRILPTVFNGKSLPLDHGRSNAAFSGHNAPRWKNETADARSRNATGHRRGASDITPAHNGAKGGAGTDLEDSGQDS